MKHPSSERAQPDEPPTNHLLRRLAGGELGPVMQALADGLRPLGPVAAQLLWLGQPLLALVERGPLAAELAERLDAPAGANAEQRRDAQTP